ncbi:MAG: nucleoside-diphosphate sugar epimerase/dehydratase [Candidatus Solibacter sp.]
MTDASDYLRRALFPVAVAAIVVTSLVAAFLLRFEFAIPPVELARLSTGIWVALIAKMTVFRLARCDRGGWRHTGIADIYMLLVSNLVSSFVFTLAMLVIYRQAFPRSVYVIDLLVCFLGTAGSRITVRLYHESLRAARIAVERNVLVYGAGAAGMALLREIRSNPSLGWHVLGLVDDDPIKLGQTLMGVPVIGRGRQLAAIVERYRMKGVAVDEIVVAMPSAPGRKIQEALANCKAAGVQCKKIPSVAALLTGKVLLSQIQAVSLEDLLGRPPVRMDEELVRRAVEGRVVMVTGGGGSIGSELCRQLASFQPRKLVIFERSESDLFRIHLEISNKFPQDTIIPVIGDIRECSSVEHAIRHHQVNSIFHAAAYKHVPVMESHVLEAVKNNILGTWTLVGAAIRGGVDSFLMISSDKAVNPTNIMGLTKRVAELIVSAMQNPDESSAVRFVSVRFGNVLGSNGSVVPIFRQQIAAGGPVTVTHPEMQRYFMTISEAVQLVLQASTMGKGSEIFVLDMGQSVRIVDLARDMIRLSGHDPDVDIEIRFTGCRPGEKLFEELVLDSEDTLDTYHEKIKIFRGPLETRSDMESWLAELEVLVSREDERAVVSHLKRLVPEYQPMGVWREVDEPMKAQAAEAS